MSVALKPDAPEPGSIATLRTAALVVLLAATFGCIGLTVYVGRQNPSIVLLALFCTWVSSPFVGAVLANRVARQWETSARTTLYIVMLILSVGCLAVYAAVAFGPPQPQQAKYFLMTPLLSWLLVAMPIAIGAKGARKR